MAVVSFYGEFSRLTSVSATVQHSKSCRVCRALGLHVAPLWHIVRQHLPLHSTQEAILCRCSCLLSGGILALFLSPHLLFESSDSAQGILSYPPPPPRARPPWLPKLPQDAVVCGRNAAAAAASRGAVGVRRMGAAAAQDSNPAPLYPDAVLKVPEIHQAKVGMDGRGEALDVCLYSSTKYYVTLCIGPDYVLGEFFGRRVPAIAQAY